MNAEEHIEFGDLAAFALHTLEEGETAPIAHHVRSCSVCRSELAKIREDLGLYAQLTRVHELPEGSRQKVLDQVAHKKMTASRIWSLRKEVYDVAKSVEGERAVHSKSKDFARRLP